MKVTKTLPLPPPPPPGPTYTLNLTQAEMTGLRYLVYVGKNKAGINGDAAIERAGDRLYKQLDTMEPTGAFGWEGMFPVEV